MTSVLVIDDHAVVASGTRAVLQNAGFEVESQPSAKNIVALLKEKHFDLFVIDLNMPDMDGMAASDLILDLDPDAKIIIYTGYETEIEPLFASMIERGIAGVVSKSASIDSLIAALNAALRDEVLLPIWLVQRLHVRDTERKSGTNVHLNQTERKILTGVMRGETNRDIAGELLIGQRTVEKHLTGIFQKLGVHSRIEAIERVNELGLIRVPKRNA
ncbi:two component transcriptional regulator, LuxR family [Sporolactobacillus inulinus]|jgi:two-component system competent response regulator ComA|uniref:Two component transcriptional regulator, LuxR family n=1 Tax=Sporolactobacillus inulinus TaxID=2078 RepID=A0A4Y1ZH30_9BACL|nr:response regulator transcription factor [Sporolactobacillus inulinus]GAY78506.1 two component transcriptional regulator, LuxR family [Sporolactobacillus inulinus]